MATGEPVEVLFSFAELEDITAKIDAALSSGRVGAWETKFLGDMKARIARYGRDVRLSEKQFAKLHEILERAGSQPRYVARSKVVPFNADVRRRRYRPYRRLRLGGRVQTKLLAFVVIAILAAVAGLWDKDVPSSERRDLLAQPSSTISANPPEFTRANISRNDFTITDGDTIRLNGERKGMRLVGFNTPEAIEPKCSKERALGQKAKARLRQLISKGRLTLERVRCACQPGTEGTQACNYGRSCGVLSVDGRDVGAILISEGLAVPFVCGSRSCPPTPRPWCL